MCNIKRDIGSSNLKSEKNLGPRSWNFPSANINSYIPQVTSFGEEEYASFAEWVLATVVAPNIAIDKNARDLRAPAGWACVRGAGGCPPRPPPVGVGVGGWLDGWVSPPAPPCGCGCGCVGGWLGAWSVLHKK